MKNELARDEPTARTFLVDFAEQGVVEKCAGGWRLTPHGRRLARDLARAFGVGE